MSALDWKELFWLAVGFTAVVYGLYLIFRGPRKVYCQIVHAKIQASICDMCQYYHKTCNINRIKYFTKKP